MRGLQTRDVFAALRVVKSAGVSNELKRIALIVQESKGKFNAKEIGTELIFTVLENCSDSNAEKQIYELFSGITEIPVEELKVMDIFELIETLKGLKNYINMEQARNFLSLLSKMSQ